MSDVARRGRWLRIRAVTALALLATALLAMPAPGAQAGGLPIGPNVQVTDAGLNSSSVDVPDVFVRGNTVYTAWQDKRDDGAVNGAIYFAQSTDGGATWSTNKRISNLAYDAWADDPVIAVQPNGAIWIVWWQFYRNNSTTVNDIRLAKSTDGGNTFQLSILFDGDDGAEDVRYPEIAVDESTGKLYVLFHEFWVRGSSQGYEFSVITFSADGQKLTTTLVNDVPVPGRGSNDFLQNPRGTLTARNGVVCAAWEDTRSRFSIYGACSSDGGATFGANVAISASDMERPRIALAPDGGLYATYRGTADARKNVLLRRSADKGATWGDVRNVTKLTEDEVRTWDLAVDDNGQLSVPWVYRDFSSSDLFLATSLDQGISFAKVLVEDNQGQFPTVSDQFGVAVAVGGLAEQTRAYLVWEDDRNSGSQVWSQTLSVDGIPPTAPANLQATSDDRSILLTWAPSTDTNGILGYRIVRSNSSGGPYTEITSLLVRGTSYRDVELDGQTYYYRVVAVDNTNNIGPASAEASATPITNAPLSAKGTLAFTSGDNVQLRDFPNGNLRTFAQGARPRFSKDGARVFYYAQKIIYAKPVAGGTPNNIFQKDDGTSWYDIADNNETRIAMVLQRTGIAPPSVGGLCFLFEPHYFDRNQEVYTGSNEQTENPALTPDAEWLAYNYRGFCNAIAISTVTPGDLCIVKIATGKSKCVGAYYREPDFSPTGGWLAFTAEYTGQHELWKAQLQADGTLTGLTQLTRGPANQPASEPNWSSDGNWLVFKRDVDPTAGVNWQLHIVRADGAGVRNLAVAGEEPAWFGGGTAPPNPNLQTRAFLPWVTR